MLEHHQPWDFRYVWDARLLAETAYNLKIRVESQITAEAGKEVKSDELADLELQCSTAAKVAKVMLEESIERLEKEGGVSEALLAKFAEAIKGRVEEKNDLVINAGTFAAASHLPSMFSIQAQVQEEGIEHASLSAQEQYPSPPS